MTVGMLSCMTVGVVSKMRVGVFSGMTVGVVSEIILGVFFGDDSGNVIPAKAGIQEVFVVILDLMRKLFCYSVLDTESLLSFRT